MRIFQIISIILSVLFVVFLVLNGTVIHSEGLTNILSVSAIVIAILNIIANIGWILTSENEREASWQLSWYNRLHPGD